LKTNAQVNELLLSLAICGAAKKAEARAAKEAKRKVRLENFKLNRAACELEVQVQNAANGVLPYRGMNGRGDELQQQGEAPPLAQEVRDSIRGQAQNDLVFPLGPPARQPAAPQAQQPPTQAQTFSFRALANPTEATYAQPPPQRHPTSGYLPSLRHANIARANPLQTGANPYDGPFGGVLPARYAVPCTEVLPGQYPTAGVLPVRYDQAGTMASHHHAPLVVGGQHLARRVVQLPGKRPRGPAKNKGGGGAQDPGALLQGLQPTMGRNPSQWNYLHALRGTDPPVVIGVGAAGTGKTQLACAVGLEKLLTGEVWNGCWSLYVSRWRWGGRLK
jgi:hypothetical protein